jgi:protein SPT2
VEDEYYGEEEHDLDDFIVYSSDDDENKALKNQALHEQQVEADQEEDFEEEAPVGAQEILSLREQLKEKIRRKNAAVMAAGAGKGSSSVKQQTAPLAKYR